VIQRSLQSCLASGRRSRLCRKILKLRLTVSQMKFFLALERSLELPAGILTHLSPRINLFDSIFYQNWHILLRMWISSFLCGVRRASASESPLR